MVPFLDVLLTDLLLELFKSVPANPVATFWALRVFTAELDMVVYGFPDIIIDGCVFILYDLAC